jgi:hypothetical protein
MNRFFLALNVLLSTCIIATPQINDIINSQDQQIRKIALAKMSAGAVISVSLVALLIRAIIEDIRVQGVWGQTITQAIKNVTASKTGKAIKDNETNIFKSPVFRIRTILGYSIACYGLWRYVKFTLKNGRIAFKKEEKLLQDT